MSLSDHQRWVPLEYSWIQAALAEGKPLRSKPRAAPPQDDWSPRRALVEKLRAYFVHAAREHDEAHRLDRERRSKRGKRSNPNPGVDLELPPEWRACALIEIRPEWMHTRLALWRSELRSPSYLSDCALFGWVIGGWVPPRSEDPYLRVRLAQLPMGWSRIGEDDCDYDVAIGLDDIVVEANRPPSTPAPIGPMLQLAWC